MEDEIERVLIIGAGTMGRQIALQCAMHGLDVHLYDVDQAALDDAQQGIRQYTAQLMYTGHLTHEQAAEARQRITTTTDPEAAADGVDLVSESIPEDAQLKGKVFGQFDRLCRAHTLFTTNTSTLLPSEFAEATGRPDRFAALHFHPPVWHANIADVMPHAGTDPATTERLMAFARRIGQIPLLIEKESRGYIFNAMLEALLNAALGLAANEVASPQDVDRAWMGITKMPIGPFGMIDMIGVDLVHHITAQAMGPMANFPKARKILDLLETRVDQGHLGAKTGQGFYAYPKAAFKQEGFVEGGVRADAGEDEEA